MATSVYSQQFIVSNDADGTDNFEVPADWVAVIRQCSLYQSAGGALLQVQIQDSGAAPAVCIANLQAAGVANYDSIEGRWVVPGGGFISLASEYFGAGLNVYVGGYLLGPGAST